MSIYEITNFYMVVIRLFAIVPAKRDYLRNYGLE